MDLSLSVMAQMILDEINKPNATLSKNIVVSPTSITIILSLLAYHGSAGETLRQFLNVLGEHKHQSLLNSKFQKLTSIVAVAADESSSTGEEFSGVLPLFFCKELPLYRSDKAEVSAVPRHPLPRMFDRDSCDISFPPLPKTDADRSAWDLPPRKEVSTPPENGVAGQEPIVSTGLANGVPVKETIPQGLEPVKPVGLGTGVPGQEPVIFTGISNGVAVKEETTPQGLEPVGLGNVVLLQAEPVFSTILGYVTVIPDPPAWLKRLWLEDRVPVNKPVEIVKPRQELAFSMLNALWVDQRYPLRSSFKEALESVHKALVRSVDLMSQTPRGVIEEVNSWAEKETEGVIKDLLPEDAQLESPLSLVNALHMKASWHSPFVPKYTRDEDFYLFDGKTKKATFMMNQNTHYLYASTDDFELLELWFDQPGQSTKNRFSMYIFMPYTKEGLRRLAKRLGSNPASLSPAEFKFSPVYFSRVSIPKMDLSHEFRAEKLFKDKGLSKAFDKRSADFTNMFDSYMAKGNLYFRMFLHKARVQLDQEDVAEAAATAVIADIRSNGEPKSPPSFVADHPFLFLIVEDRSKLVVFAGALLNPPSE